MKKLILIVPFLIFVIVGCENTSNCKDQINFIEYDKELNIVKGDSVHLPYEKMLIANSFSYDTEIKQDTIFEQDTTIVYDTVFTNRLFGFSIISDTSETNYLLGTGDEIQNGDSIVGEHFNLIKLYLEDIELNGNNSNPVAVITVYKGVFYSDCSTW
jgi:uncharacterized lipoprotein NlpE involved in copper resistance